MTDSHTTPEGILATCERIARRGEYFEVHRYRYRDESLRRKCLRLKKAGKLRQANTENPIWAFYRPEDVPVIEAAQQRHAEAMKKVHAQNVGWHLEQAEKNKIKYPDLAAHHLKQAEEERRLSQ